MSYASLGHVYIGVGSVCYGVEYLVYVQIPGLLLSPDLIMGRQAAFFAHDSVDELSDIGADYGLVIEGDTGNVAGWRHIDFFAEQKSDRGILNPGASYLFCYFKVDRVAFGIILVGGVHDEQIIFHGRDEHGLSAAEGLAGYQFSLVLADIRLLCKDTLQLAAVSGMCIKNCCIEGHGSSLHIF